MATATRTSSRRQRILPARYQDSQLSPPPTTSTPRGTKRPSPEPSSSPPSNKRHHQPAQTDLSIHKTLGLTAYPSTSAAPRITVPLDIDVTDVPLPSWIDLSVDYWTLWRHYYDKWNIQSKFAQINAAVHGDSEGVDIAREERDRLWHIRERLLTDHPDRQDIDVRSRRAVKHVWRFLSKRQGQRVECAEFKCSRVERSMGWQIDDDEDQMWDQIGAYLLDQGNEGRIFIDPREFYDHFSWCVEDSGKEISNTTLAEFYDTFARRGKSEMAWTTVDCEECSGSTQVCYCEETCLSCLPQVDGVPPISPLSSLPSPPRTPGTTSLQAYFKGKRLSHPPPPVDVPHTDDDAANILLSFAGITIPEQSREHKRRGRSKRTNESTTGQT
jgi:hypothetical protein